MKIHGLRLDIALWMKVYILSVKFMTHDEITDYKGCDDLDGSR